MKHGNVQAVMDGDLNRIYGSIFKNEIEIR